MLAFIRRNIKFIVFCSILAVPVAAVLVFFIRYPVIIVTNDDIKAIYGEERARRREIFASIALFRRVKPVVIPDTLSPDLIIITIAETAKRQFCVLFPFAYSETAAQYHYEFPDTKVVLLAGNAETAGLPSANGIFCVYRTNQSTDLYRAGLFAGIIGEARQKAAEKALAGNESESVQNLDVALLHGALLHSDYLEHFSKGVEERFPDSNVVFFKTVSEMPDSRTLSSVTLVGTASEYFERAPRAPLIIFSWLNPEFVPETVRVIFDDSVWALAVPAVRMAAKKTAVGEISSKTLMISGKPADNVVLKRLRRSAGKTL